MQASDWTQINITFVPNHKDSNESWNWFVKGGIPGALSPVLENFRRRFSWPNWPPLGLRWWETSWGALVKVLLNTYFFCHQVQDIYKGYSCLKCLKIVSGRYMSPLVYSLSKILIFVLSRKTQQFFLSRLSIFSHGSRGSRTNTDRFPKRAPKTQGSRGGLGGMYPGEFLLDFKSLELPFLGFWVIQTWNWLDFNLETSYLWKILAIFAKRCKPAWIRACMEMY